MKALSLFSGIGGLDLAAAPYGIKPAAFCEIEPFPREILKKRFPGVFIAHDIREIRGDEIGELDIIHGGFPCQDLSVAGKRKGLLDENGEQTRSGLWFEMLRVIREGRPRFVVAENVRGAVNAALDTVAGGLESSGYKIWPVLISASHFGARHQRERLFIFGVRADIANKLDDADSALRRCSFCRKPEEKIAQGVAPNTERPSGGNWRTPDAHCERGALSKEAFERRKAQGLPMTINFQVGGRLNPDWMEQLMGYPHGWTDPECDEVTPWAGWPAGYGAEQYVFEYPRTTQRMKNRVARLKALGNSVVPQQAQFLFDAIARLNNLAKGAKGGAEAWTEQLSL